MPLYNTNTALIDQSLEMLISVKWKKKHFDEIKYPFLFFNKEKFFFIKFFNKIRILGLFLTTIKNIPSMPVINILPNGKIF